MNKTDSKSLIQGFALIEIILVAVIVLFLMYKLFTLYFRKPTVNKETEKALSEEGISTANYKSTLDSVREKIKNIEQQQAGQAEGLESR